MATSDEASFGELLKTYRERAHLSQSDLAELAGLSRRGISDLERGARRAPQRETTRRLVDALRLREQERELFLSAAREGHFTEATASPALAVPLALTSFVGRERQLEDVLHLLGSTRLLTLTGTGGIGKTRLALEVARYVQPDYADGVVMADLSPLTEATEVPYAVASSLRVREQPAAPISASIVEFLKSRQLLLILDNCEHLLGACARLVEQLLSECPNLRILATSREPLSVWAESRWLLPPLETGTEAVQLFFERARAVVPQLRATEPNVAAIVDICRRLDGLPLAIELIATWVGVLPLPEIARRLDDRLLAGGSRTAQPRQQSLRASLEWSFQLLAAHEARLFHRLAVFSGGWTLEAAEAVLAGAGGDDDVLSTLRHLLDKSLIVVEPTLSGVRYRFLEAVRRFAVERLQAAGEAEDVGRRHAVFFVDLAARATSELSGPHSTTRPVDLESEHDNLRATVRWVIGHADVEAAHVLGTALARFSQIGNHLSEGRAWLSEILALSDAPTAGRARTLIGAGLLAAYQGDYQLAEARLLEGVRICRQLGEDRELAHGLFALGLMAWTRGDYVAAGRFGEEGVTVSRRAGHRGFESLHLFVCGASAAEAGDYGSARKLAEECYAIATHANFGRAIGLSLGVLGMLRYVHADYEESESLLDKAVGHLHAAGIPVAVAWATSLQARVKVGQGEAAQARALCAEALRLVRSFDLKGRAPFVLETVALVLATDGQPRQALVLAAAAEAIRRQLGVTSSATDRARVNDWLVPLTGALGDRADELWSTGVALSLTDAIDLAIAHTQRNATGLRPESRSAPASPSRHAT